MPRYVNIEPLEKDFQERFNYLFDKSQTKIGEDKWLIDESIQNAAVIAKEFLDKTKRLPTADVQEVIQPGEQPNLSYESIQEKLLSGVQDLAKEICEVICPEIDHEEDETACGLITEYIKSQIGALK